MKLFETHLKTKSNRRVCLIFNKGRYHKYDSKEKSTNKLFCIRYWQ